MANVVASAPPVRERDMPFLAHLEELRRRIIFSICVLSILVVHRSRAVSHREAVCPSFLGQHGGTIPCRWTVRLQGGLSGLPALPDRYGEQFQPMITIGEYTKLFATIIIGLGLTFEMPILASF